MTLKQQISSIPDALGETLEKGRTEFEAVIRQTRWGDGAIFLTGSGASSLAAQAGAYAFESFAGWPVVSRPAHEFRAYTIGTMRPRSVLLAVSQSGETAETLDVAESAKRRGAIVLAVTGNPESALGKMAQGVFLVRAGQEKNVASFLCQQTALSYLGVRTARLLKRPEKHLAGVEADLEKLPEQADWVLGKLHDVFRAFAAELRGAAGFPVIAGGFYRPAARAWALLVRASCRAQVEAWDPGEFQPNFLAPGPGQPVVILSGSRCRMKKEIQQVVNACSQLKLRILSVTDSADHEVTKPSALAVMLPAVSEAAGSVLGFVLLASVAAELQRST